MDRPLMQPLDTSAALDARVAGLLEGQLTEQAVLDFWRDGWTDEAGRRWQIQPLDTGLAPRKPREDLIYCGGHVLCDGNYAGKFERKLDLSRNRVGHDNLSLRPEYQGKGFATEWLSRCCERYQQLGIEQVTLETDNDGLTTWPHFGFDLECEHSRDWNSMYGREMRKLIDYMGDDAHTERDIHGHAAYDSFRTRLDEISNAPEAPTLLELVSIDRWVTTGLLENMSVDLRASPETILAEISRRRELRSGEQALDI
jgi:GNAT superfamily N-acetyltransferase